VVNEVDADAVGLSFRGTLHGLVCLVTDGTILYKSRSEEKMEKLIEQAVRGLFLTLEICSSINSACLALELINGDAAALHDQPQR